MSSGRQDLRSEDAAAQIGPLVSLDEGLGDHAGLNAMIGQPDLLRGDIVLSERVQQNLRQ